MRPILGVTGVEERRGEIDCGEGLGWRLHRLNHRPIIAVIVDRVAGNRGSCA
jgi:hypothetical protein